MIFECGRLPLNPEKISAMDRKQASFEGQYCTFYACKPGEENIKVDGRNRFTQDFIRHHNDPGKRKKGYPTMTMLGFNECSGGGYAEHNSAMNGFF